MFWHSQVGRGMDSAASSLWAADCQKVEVCLKRKIVWYFLFLMYFLTPIPGKQFCYTPFVLWFEKNDNHFLVKPYSQSFFIMCSFYPSKHLSFRGTLQMCSALCLHCCHSWGKIVTRLKQELAWSAKSRLWHKHIWEELAHSVLRRDSVPLVAALALSTVTPGSISLLGNFPASTREDTDWRGLTG